MKVSLLNQYYKSKASDNNASDLLNMYLEEDKAEGKYQIIAYSRPGLSNWNTGSGSQVRGGINHEGVAYFVVDNKLYSYASNGTRTERGTLNSSSGRVVLGSIPNQIEIIDDVDIYNYNSSTNTFTIVSNSDRPTNPRTLAAQDGFFLFGVLNSDIIYGSEVADGTSFNPLSFNTKNGNGDYVNGLISNKRNVHVLGTEISEIWYNSGAATFSFETLDLGAIFHYGCLARHSVSRGQDSIFYFGQNEAGGRCVITMDALRPVVVSTRALENTFNGFTTIDDAFGYCFKYNSHEFYLLTFPTEAKTFVYDMTTGVWSEWTSYISSSYTRFIGNCHVNAYGKNLVGSYNSGTIFQVTQSSYTDAGSQIKRQIVSPPGYLEGNKIFFERLQLDVQTGVGSNIDVNLDISKDSGRTYTAFETKSLPATGGRLFWYRLGMTQQAFAVRVNTIEDAEFTVLGAVAQISSGIH